MRRLKKKKRERRKEIEGVTKDKKNERYAAIGV